MQPSKFASTSSSLWNRIRLQLGMGLLLAAVVPYFVRRVIEAELGGDRTSLDLAFAGTVVAVIGGYFGFRRMSHYPGVRLANSIMPAFTMSYGLVLLAFFMTRLDYSRLQFLASFVVCVAWYYLVYFMVGRQRVRVGVVPFGAVDSVYETPAFDCVTLSGPGDDLDGLNAIIADLRVDLPDAWERFLADQAINDMLVLDAKQAVESITGRVAIEHLSENNFGSLIPGIVYGKVKRGWDLALVVVAAVPVAVVLLVAATAIKLDSRGPVFFTQPRMGYRGRVFTIWKLRTMRPERSADDTRFAAMTRANDDRVTRVGRFLRQYRVDELPQILNVLRGEMSWIGPRPEAVPLSQWYEAELPFYRYRHIVRPGITGWAQVRQGHVAEVDEVLGKLHYDFYYIKNFSFWLDVLIVARTLRTILSGFGAR